MKGKKGMRWGFILLIFSLLAACGTAEDNMDTAHPTPTSTPIIAGGDTSPISKSRCETLSGEFEIQVLMGPAEVVGLEPAAVGNIPFTVTNGVVQGGGALTYQEVLGADWGTYTVYFDMEIDLSGNCVGKDGNEILNINMTSSGNQLVEVRAEGFQGDYPWEGTHEFDLTFPVEDGATAEGEGWVFVLHIDE